MTFTELLADVIARLEGSGVPYMVTGSLASTYHGEARATRDLDIVIDPVPRSLEDLVGSLEGAGYYVDAEAARAALRDRSQFNAVGDDASKIDFIVRKDRPFSREEFGRRREADLLGSRGYIATAEDMIVAKLEWAVATDSERQLRDVAGMLAVTGDALDRAYVERWVAVLGLTSAWNRVRTPR